MQKFSQLADTTPTHFDRCPFCCALQNIVELSFLTDAFGQLQKADGGALDGKGGAAAWMDWWTIFYWGWWVAWSPFVGMFIAKISKNRKISEVISVVVTAPLIFMVSALARLGGLWLSWLALATNHCTRPHNIDFVAASTCVRLGQIIWFSVFGGAAINHRTRSEP